MLGVPNDAICNAFATQPEDPRPPALRRVRVPVLVVSGVLDQATPPAYGGAVAKALPSATHVVLPTGHSPALAAGACGVRLLSTFLAATGAKLPRCGDARAG